MSFDQFQKVAKKPLHKGKSWMFSEGELTPASAAEDAYGLDDGLLCVPTGFDLQVHLRFPGQPEKETLEGGLRSAFVGGYDGVCTMPNTRPFLDTPDRLKAAIESFDAAARDLPEVAVYFTGAATLGMQGREVSDIPGLVKAGARAITDDGWGVRDDEAMLAALKQCADCDVPFLQHAETPGHGGVATASDFQRRNHLAVYPRNVESDMIRRDLKLLSEVPQARYHVLHVSTIESLDLIDDAKQRGLPITCEVTPHHLYFSNEDIPQDELATNYKMNPPLFSADDRSRLQTALAEGLIDCVSTDHAPHEKDSKQNPWSESPFGTRGLVTALPVLIELYQHGVISWERLVSSYSDRGREILGLDKKSRGLLFVDPDSCFEVTEQELPGVSKNSCFLGHQFKARIMARFDRSGLWCRFIN